MSRVPREDAELLSSWQAGDLAAGDALFNRYFARIYRFFRNKLGDETIVEELMQRTFVGCVEGRDRLREQTSFRSYLFGTAHNTLRAYFREKRREHARIDFGAASAVDLGGGPVTLLMAGEEQRLLLEALRRIPLDDQVVLELYYFEAMSASEIGAVLGLPEGTVRGRIRAAKQRMSDGLAALASSPRLLRSTLHNLDDWARGLRAQLAPAGRQDPP